MRHVTVTEAAAEFDRLVAEVESTGHEVVINRDGKPVAQLVRANAELSPEELATRKQAVRNLREMARKLKFGATQEEIKKWISDGRH